MNRPATTLISKGDVVLRGITRLVVCLVMLFMCVVTANAETIDVKNPGFEEIDEMGMPIGWRLTMYNSSEMITEGMLLTNAPEGDYCAYIINEEFNDARFEQKINVEKDTLYRFSCLAMAEGCSETGKGANLSVLEGFDGSPDLKDTGGMWKPLEFYGRTGPNQTQITLAVRLGGFGADCDGKAWFDSVMVEKVDSAPAGVMVSDLESVTKASENRANDSQAEEAQPSSPGKFNTQQSLLFAFIFVIVLLIADRRFPRIGLKNAGRTMVCVIAASVLFRLIIAYVTPGYEADINCFRSWGMHMAEVGPREFYQTVGFCDYPPGYMYVLWFIGGLAKLLNADSELMILLIKFVPCVIDGVLAYIVYRLAKENIGEMSALGLSAFIALNPAYFYNSAVWGQVDSVLTALLVLCIMFAVKKKWSVALPLFVASALIKPQALMFGPLGLAALVYDFVDSKQDRKERGALLENTMKGVGLSLGVFVLIVGPFFHMNDWSWIFRLYGGTLSSYPYAVLNTYNIYALMGQNWAPLSNPLFFGVPTMVWGVVAIAAAMIFGIYLIFRARDKRALWLICAAVLFGLIVFGTKMHERYIMPAIVLLAVAYGVYRDKRIKFVMASLTVTTFINIALVLYSISFQESEKRLTEFFSLANILLSVYLLYVTYDICVRGVIKTGLLFRRKGSASVVENVPKASEGAVAKKSGVGERGKILLWNLFNEGDYRLHMKWLDFLLVGILTVSYGVLAFINLGDMKAPQTGFTSTERYESVTFDLGEVRDIRRFYYYGGICKGQLKVLLSTDGESWLDTGVAYYPTNTMFRWQVFDTATGNGPKFDSKEEVPSFFTEDYDPSDFGIIAYDPFYSQEELPEGEEEASIEPVMFDTNARYARVVFRTRGLEFFEFGFGDEKGNIYPVASLTNEGARMGATQDSNNLADEQDCVAEPTYMNGTYFDEIYHARTAYEHIHGLVPYETTHPPLGKLFISLGIMLFGMTPFGWRFSGALCGVLMVPAIYLLAKQLLKRTDISFLATLLFTFDCMHFAQTRVSTIDSYPVLFIMLSYICMFRYAQMSVYRQSYKTLIPLGLCGIFMGIGMASKWIGIYSAIGLAVILFAVWVCRFAEARWAKRNLNELNRDKNSEFFQKVSKSFWPKLGVTVAFCLVFFILIPGLTYYFSYVPYLTPSDNMNLQGVIDAQIGMYNYHKGVQEPHGFQSSWWEWPLMLRPMWYYSGDFMQEGMVSEISTMGNPLVWWGGLAALIWVFYRLLSGKSARDVRMWLVVVAFAAQYLPWVLVPRSTFIYHYFASLPFTILCISLFVEEFSKKHKRAITYSYVYAAACVLIFFCFYPVISGLPVMRSSVQWLNWLPRWYLMNGAQTWPIWRMIGGWIGI